MHTLGIAEWGRCRRPGLGWPGAAFGIAGWAGRRRGLGSPGFCSALCVVCTHSASRNGGGAGGLGLARRGAAGVGLARRAGGRRRGLGSPGFCGALCVVCTHSASRNGGGAGGLGLARRGAAGVGLARRAGGRGVGLGRRRRIRRRRASAVRCVSYAHTGHRGMGEAPAAWVWLAGRRVGVAGWGAAGPPVRLCRVAAGIPKGGTGRQGPAVRPWATVGGKPAWSGDRVVEG